MAVRACNNNARSNFITLLLGFRLEEAYDECDKRTCQLKMAEYFRMHIYY
jgi:hypothetical protein